MPPAAVFISHLPLNMTPHEISNLLSRFGQIASVDVVRHPHTLHSLGAAWVNFNIDLNNINVDKKHAWNKAQQSARTALKSAHELTTDHGAVCIRYDPFGDHLDAFVQKALLDISKHSITNDTGTFFDGLQTDLESSHSHRRQSLNPDRHHTDTRHSSTTHDSSYNRRHSHHDRHSSSRDTRHHDDRRRESTLDRRYDRDRDDRRKRTPSHRRDISAEHSSSHRDRSREHSSSHHDRSLSHRLSKTLAPCFMIPLHPLLDTHILRRHFALYHPESVYKDDECWHIEFRSKTECLKCFDRYDGTRIGALKLQLRFRPIEVVPSSEVTELKGLNLFNSP